MLRQAVVQLVPVRVDSMKLSGSLSVVLVRIGIVQETLCVSALLAKASVIHVFEPANHRDWSSIKAAENVSHLLLVGRRASLLLSDPNLST